MQRQLWITMLLLVELLGSAGAGAQPQQTPQQDIPTVTITGKLAGPPLWKITRGQNTLWLFADLPLVPEDLDWDSSRVDQILSESEVFLNWPRIDSGIGVVALLTNRKLKALRDELELLDQDRTLDKALDPALYQRLNQSVPPDYLRQVSRYRPWFAATVLRNVWILGEGFEWRKDVPRELERLRRKYRVREVQSEVDFELEEMQLHLQQQVQSAGDVGAACLAAVLDFHEHADEVQMTLTQWFSGELPLSSALDPLQPCHNANGNPYFVQALEERIIEVWIGNLEQALANNKVGFAVIPVGTLFDDNYAALWQWLAQQGFDIRDINHDG